MREVEDRMMIRVKVRQARIVEAEFCFEMSDGKPANEAAALARKRAMAQVERYADKEAVDGKPWKEISRGQPSWYETQVEGGGENRKLFPIPRLEG